MKITIVWCFKVNDFIAPENRSEQTFCEKLGEFKGCLGCEHSKVKNVELDIS